MPSSENPVPTYLLERIKQFVTDPQKLKRVDTLTEEEAYAIANQGYLTPEQSTLLDQDEALHTLRVIVYQQLIDWASNEAEGIQQEIIDFISSKTFVDYPDFLTNEKIMNAARGEWINDHSQTLNQLREFDLEILGARISDHGDVEVLMTHNQVKFAYAGGGFPSFISISQKDYAIPPDVTIGLLKYNPASAIKGTVGDIYVSMKAPYPTSHTSQYIEVVLPKPATE